MLLHNYATVCCDLIRSHKLNQVRLGQSLDWEISKNCSGVMGSDGIDSKRVLRQYLFRGDVMALYVWVTRHWVVTGDPLLYCEGTGQMGYPRCLDQLKLHSFRKESERLPKFHIFLVSVGSIVYFYILVRSFILSYLAAVFGSWWINPTFCSSGNLWSTLISFLWEPGCLMN